MKLFLKMSLTLLLLYAAPATAQYIGSSRPLGRAQTLDSLAAKADTQAVRVLEQRADSDSTRIDTLEQRSIVDSTRLDSVAVASAAADTLLDARIDSVRDNTGSGGGAVDVVVVAEVPLTEYSFNMALTGINEKWARNVYQLLPDTLYDDWVAEGYAGPTGGRFELDSVNYLVDNVSFQIGTVDSTANEGASIGMGAISYWETFHNASTAADSLGEHSDYYVFDIYIDATSLANMGAVVYWHFGSGGRLGGTTNSVQRKWMSILQAALEAGWNHVYADEYALQQNMNMDNADWMGFRFSAPDDTAEIKISNMMFVRDDTTAAIPNAFGVSGSIEWVAPPSGGVMLYKEDTVFVQSFVSGDYIQSTFDSPDTMGGKIYISQTDSSYLAVRDSGFVKLVATGGDSLWLRCDGGTPDSIAFAYAAGDTIWWNLVRVSNSIKAYFWNGEPAGLPDDSLTGTYTGEINPVRIQLIEQDRLLPTGGAYTAQEYAAQYSVLEFTIGDSAYYVEPDSIVLVP